MSEMPDAELGTHPWVPEFETISSWWGSNLSPESNFFKSSAKAGNPTFSDLNFWHFSSSKVLPWEWSVHHRPQQAVRRTHVSRSFSQSKAGAHPKCLFRQHLRNHRKNLGNVENEIKSCKGYKEIGQGHKMTWDDIRWHKDICQVLKTCCGAPVLLVRGPAMFLKLSDFHRCRKGYQRIDADSESVWDLVGYGARYTPLTPPRSAPHSSSHLRNRRGRGGHHLSSTSVRSVARKPVARPNSALAMWPIATHRKAQKYLFPVS